MELQSANAEYILYERRTRAAMESKDEFKLHLYICKMEEAKGKVKRASGELVKTLKTAKYLNKSGIWTMELNDINKHTAKKMNKLLESRYGFVVDYDKMTPAKAEKILAVINESIAQVKKSSAAHTAYKDPRYMEMLMVKESVSKYMRDYKPEMNKPGEKSAPKLQAAPKLNISASQHKKYFHMQVKS